jgi:hypothetical protein
MWKSFVLELHGEWSEFADECIGLLAETETLVLVDSWTLAHLQVSILHLTRQTFPRSPSKGIKYERFSKLF